MTREIARLKDYINMIVKSLRLIKTNSITDDKNLQEIINYKKEKENIEKHYLELIKRIKKENTDLKNENTQLISSYNLLQKENNNLKRNQSNRLLAIDNSFKTLNQLTHGKINLLTKFDGLMKENYLSIDERITILKNYILEFKSYKNSHASCGRYKEILRKISSEIETIKDINKENYEDNSYKSFEVDQETLMKMRKANGEYKITSKEVKGMITSFLLSYSKLESILQEVLFYLYRVHPLYVLKFFDSFNIEMDDFRRLDKREFSQKFYFFLNIFQLKIIDFDSIYDECVESKKTHNKGVQVETAESIEANRRFCLENSTLFLSENMPERMSYGKPITVYCSIKPTEDINCELNIEYVTHWYIRLGVNFEVNCRVKRKTKSVIIYLIMLVFVEKVQPTLAC